MGEYFLREMDFVPLFVPPENLLGRRVVPLIVNGSKVSIVSCDSA